MVKIRLKRTGTRNRACFRVVVMDARASRDGKAIEEIGFYDPILKVEKMDMDRYNYWPGHPSPRHGNRHDYACRYASV